METLRRDIKNLVRELAGSLAKAERTTKVAVLNRKYEEHRVAEEIAASSGYVIKYSVRQIGQHGEKKKMKHGQEFLPKQRSRDWERLESRAQNLELQALNSLKVTEEESKKKKSARDEEGAPSLDVGLFLEP